MKTMLMPMRNGFTIEMLCLRICQNVCRILCAEVHFKRFPIRDTK